MAKKGYWLNTTDIRVKDIAKPCIKLKYCPYGQLVENYPLNIKPSRYSCTTENGAIMPFGYNCPVHYLAECLESLDEPKNKKQPTVKAVNKVEKKQPKKIEQPKKKSTNNWPFN